MPRFRGLRPPWTYARYRGCSRFVPLPRFRGLRPGMDECTAENGRQFVPLPRFRGLRLVVIGVLGVKHERVCPLAPFQGIATFHVFQRTWGDVRQVCPLAPFQGIATVRVRAQEEELLPGFVPLPRFRGLRLDEAERFRREACRVCPLAPLVAGYCMKPRSNRSDPAAVKAPQNPHHDNSGYRVPVLRPFPAHGPTTLFRVFHATSGFGDCDFLTASRRS